MVSVTQRVRVVKQPRGGYLPIKQFSTVKLNDDIILSENENINPIIIGLAVDYLTRFLLVEKPAKEAFRISLMGAEIMKESKNAQQLLEQVIDLDDNSITSACKLSGFDSAFRAGPLAYKPIDNINPDQDTISNIRIMVNRALSFIKSYGPIIKSGFNFERGYTSEVDKGDGDFLTKDTLWDFKVSKTKPKKEATLQLIMYYLMGVNSIHSEFDSIKEIGIFNPRLNEVYKLSVTSISKEIINDIKTKVIGY